MSHSCPHLPHFHLVLWSFPPEACLPSLAPHSGQRIDFPQSSNPDMSEIIFQSSRLSSGLPKKNPTAQSNGLSIDTAKAWETTLPESNTQEPTGRTQKVRPVGSNDFPLLNHCLLLRYWPDFMPLLPTLGCSTYQSLFVVGLVERINVFIALPFSQSAVLVWGQ